MKNSEQLRLNIATLLFTIVIALLGFLMMTISSSPMMKGAAFIWLPAALQLIAGIWLGPWRGLIAGGLGAYLAGILAYGGYGLPDIIMNPIAGGLANSFLPVFLFKWFKIKADLGAPGEEIKRGVKRIIILLAGTILLIILFWFLKMGNWGYLPPAIFLVLTPIFFKDLKLNKRDFIFAVFVVIFISFVSAYIGYWGMRVGGLDSKPAIISSIGWFLGDSISGFLGLIILASYTNEARENGICIN